MISLWETAWLGFVILDDDGNPTGRLRDDAPPEAVKQYEDYKKEKMPRIDENGNITEQDL